MPGDMLEERAPDSEDFVCCWLQPLIRAATKRVTGDVSPFAVVYRYDGDDDQETGTATHYVQVDTLGLGDQVAAAAAWDVHYRMMLLAREQSDVEMSDGSTANADFVNTEMLPKKQPYKDDRYVRYVARYVLGLSYVATD